MSIPNADPRHSSDLEFLLIARHGSRDRDLKDVREVAAKLGDALCALPERIRISKVYYANSNQAMESAFALVSTANDTIRQHPFGAGTFISVPVSAANSGLDLSPSWIAPYWKQADPPEIGTKALLEQWWDAVENELECARKARGNGNALLLIGHQPALDWLLARQVDTPVPLATGELAVLARPRGWRSPRFDKRWYQRSKNQWHLWWVLSPGDTATISELRDKIGSKLTVLSILAAFTTALLVEAAFNFPAPSNEGSWQWREILHWIALALFAVAIAIEATALVAYDQLRMPHRFWAASLPDEKRLLRPQGPGLPWRPPSGAGWIIFLQSVRLWRWVVVAMALTGIGITALISTKTCGSVGQLSVVMGALLLAAGVMWWWRGWRRTIGTQD